MTTGKAPSKDAMEAASKLRSDLIDGFALTEPEWLAISAAALEAFATDMNDGDRTFKRLAQTERALDAAEARLAKVRERAIKPDIDGGSFYCCLLCNGGYWQQDKPERHNAPDCPARPMEDAS